MQKILESIPQNIKLIISSVLPLSIVLILFIIAVPFGISKISDIQTQIDTATRNKTILSQKLSLLQSLSATASQDSSTALSALPDSNTSLVAVSQIKNISSQNGISVSGIKAGSEIDDPSGASHVAVTFQATGSRAQIISFLKSIANMAPITLVDKIKINGIGGAEVADITIQSYWSAFPKNLPSLTTPITDLTPAEENVLSSISSLSQPTFLVVPPSEGNGKTDPFSK